MHVGEELWAQKSTLNVDLKPRVVKGIAFRSVLPETTSI
jgi:hypothetical protein